MIKRLYIDNYKCFVNFELELQHLNLLIGDNGSGKSTLFEVFHLLRNLIVEQQTVGELFSPKTLTRWQDRSIQTFELELEGNNGIYSYKLEIEYLRQEQKRRIRVEELRFDEKLIFASKLGDVQLYRDDFTAGPKYPFDWNRSGLATILPRRDNSLLSWFKDRINKIHVLRIDPKAMTARSEGEDETPEVNLSNFASWYRHLSQEEPGKVFDLFNSLKEIIEGFDALRLASDGGARAPRTLEMQQRITPEQEKESELQKHVEFDFEELSDGQRVLIALHTLLHFAVDKDTTLCIDEPDNFVALREIEPWLNELADISAETSQFLLISHHPKLINILALEKGIAFQRSYGTGPVRAKLFSADTSSGLTVSELVARGWQDE